jgi:hypothetical protein
MHRRSAVAVLLGVTTASLVVASVGIPPAVAMGAGSGWQSQTIAEHPVGLPAFEPIATSALSPSDVWVVGNPPYGSPDQQATVLHWDGTRWSQVPLPPTKTSFLTSVVAVSTDDVWAVGSDAHLGNRPRILHWDGHAGKRFPTPRLAGASAYLYALSADSSSDVWAVGEKTIGAHVRALVEHWDGTSWRVVRTPRVAGNAVRPGSISAVSPTDVWLVGYVATTKYETAQLVEHWDGSQWARVKTPDAGNGPLTGVSAVSASDVWAVGWAGGSTLVEHWDGQAWTIEASPSPGMESSLYGVTATSASDVWAVGSTHTGDHPTTFEPLILHWDGQTWEPVAVAGRSGQRDYLASVSADSSTDAWTVGFTGTKPIIRHWDGQTWS